MTKFYILKLNMKNTRTVNSSKSMILVDLLFYLCEMEQKKSYAHFTKPTLNIQMVPIIGYGLIP